MFSLSFLALKQLGLSLNARRQRFTLSENNITPSTYTQQCLLEVHRFCQGLW